MSDSITRWCRVAAADREFYGLLEGDEVVEFEGSPFGEHRRTETLHPLSALRVLLPCRPYNFYSSALNYQSHAEWGVAAGLIPGPAQPAARPDPQYRASSALIPTEETIVIPGDSTGEVHYEAELVAVIGRTAKGLTQANALDCVLGYTLGNDVSERSWAKTDRTLWRWKNADTFKPMGPVIATGIDPLRLGISVRINGRTVSEFNTADMFWGPAQQLALLSRYITLHPGDVYWLGTAGATLPALQPGDVVEIECPEIGVLRNPVAKGPDLSREPSGMPGWD